MLKADDDTYVVVTNLMARLRHLDPGQPSMLGHLQTAQGATYLRCGVVALGGGDVKLLVGTFNQVLLRALKFSRSFVCSSILNFQRRPRLRDDPSRLQPPGDRGSGAGGPPAVCRGPATPQGPGDGAPGNEGVIMSVSRR